MNKIIPLAGTALLLASSFASAEYIELHDKKRNRIIPVTFNVPDNETCSVDEPCPVAIFSAGNKVPYERYSFLTDKFREMGYMTLSVNHELPSDPPLSKTGDLYLNRIENWERGAETLDFVINEMPKAYGRGYDFDNVVLVGHSNGGDISTWAANSGKEYISTLITLDHKRVSLPRTKSIHVLSINSPEYPTKEGVLYNSDEQKQYGSEVHLIEGSKHMDFSDFGTEEVHKKTNQIIEQFLQG
ncbi:Bll5160 protein [Photobacterium aphoticum]|uniref:Bll5160 protein n=1 Tax=Photobacterium aphoticum TaxID=754436 RepID=A0A090QLK8_9GAMM|nr:Bll5160 protein [Photobacterium aphoticum]